MEGEETRVGKGRGQSGSWRSTKAKEGRGIFSGLSGLDSQAFVSICVRVLPHNLKLDSVGYFEHLEIWVVCGGPGHPILGLISLRMGYDFLAKF